VTPDGGDALVLATEPASAPIARTAANAVISRTLRLTDPPSMASATGSADAPFVSIRL
jgi:hypothetical protein